MRRNLLLGGAILALAIGPVRADRWMPPGEATYVSSDQRFRLTVLPRVLSSSQAYWSDHQADPRKRGQAPGQREACVGQLERRMPDGSCALVWRRDLVNDVAPVSALVTRDGRYVATFDNWHAMGWGNSAVVLYGPEGELLASFALGDFLTKEQIAQLSHTVSSIAWGGLHRFDASEEHLILEIVKHDTPWLTATLSLHSPAAEPRVTPAPR